MRIAIFVLLLLGFPLVILGFLVIAGLIIQSNKILAELTNIFKRQEMRITEMDDDGFYIERVSDTEIIH